jgi:diacylglycerol kinase family enzyme
MPGDATQRDHWTVTPEAVPPGSRSATWLARLSFALVVSAVAVVAVEAGLKSIAMLAVALVAAAVSLAAAFWFLSRRGALRWLSLTLFVAAPVAVIVVYALHSLLWVALVGAAGWLLAGTTAREALVRDRGEWRMPEYPVTRRALRPFLIMNPKSGGGKVGRFDLQRKAKDLGAEVFLIDGPEPVDVAEVARAAVTRGADLLGVAGGDGTQALVAGIAAEHGIPFIVISAGTRNHFALDLGLDRANPPACLRALTDGVELRVDLGVIGGRTFVNNASFGAYAAVVQDPAYRADKVRTTLELLPDLLQGQRGPQLTVHTDGVPISAPQALLVANNPYGTGDIAGLGRQEVTVTADTRQVPVGVDGEAVSLPVPVRCVIRPRALRVWVPRDRPGVPAAKPALDWARLRRLASGEHGPSPAGIPASQKRRCASPGRTLVP